MWPIPAACRTWVTWTHQIRTVTREITIVSAARIGDVFGLCRTRYTPNFKTPGQLGKRLYSSSWLRFWGSDSSDYSLETFESTCARSNPPHVHVLSREQEWWVQTDGDFGGGGKTSTRWQNPKEPYWPGNERTAQELAILMWEPPGTVLICFWRPKGQHPRFPDRLSIWPDCLLAEGLAMGVSEIGTKKKSGFAFKKYPMWEL
jgi:hypothetical protein